MRDIKIFLCCVITVSISFYVYHTFYLAPKIKEIKENMRIADGVIIFVTFENYKGHTGTIEYEYVVNEKTMRIKTPLHNASKFSANNLLYKHFAVVYSSLHNETSQILLEKEDSLEYNIK